MGEYETTIMILPIFCQSKTRIEEQTARGRESTALQPRSYYVYPRNFRDNKYLLAGNREANLVSQVDGEGSATSVANNRLQSERGTSRGLRRALDAAQLGVSLCGVANQRNQDMRNRCLLGCTIADDHLVGLGEFAANFRSDLVLTSDRRSEEDAIFISGTTRLSDGTSRTYTDCQKITLRNDGGSERNA